VGPSGRITRLLAVALLFFLPVRGVASPLLMGIGRPAQPAIALLVMGAVNLVVSVVLVRPYGIFGVALGTALPCVVYSIAVAYIACRAIEVPFTKYLRYVVGRPVVGALLPVLLLVALRHAPGIAWSSASRALQFVHLAVAGVAMVAIFGATWLTFVYRHDPYFDLAAKAGRFLPRALRSRL
jgi:O-antigen/teichoic acid export membrane protein